jgi:dipeptidyl aminopeptidase/acylaminoacyl peptidase
MRTLACSLLLALTAAAQQPATTARALSPEDVAAMRAVTGVFVHGERVAFTRSVPRLANDKPGGSRAQLWLLEDGSEKLLIGGESSVRGVAWQPGRERLTFVDKREDDPHPEVYAIDPDSGAVDKVTDTPHGVDSYEWRPDGAVLAYTVTDPPSAAQQKARKLGFQHSVHDEDFRHVSLWIHDAGTGESRRLTSERTVFSFHWNPQGTALAAGIAPRNLVDDSYMFTRLHLVDAGTGEVALLVDNPGKLGDYAWSSDGKRLAFIGAVDRNDPHAGMLHVVDVATKRSRCLTPDLRGMVEHVEWVATNRGVDRLRAVISKGVTTWMAHIDPDSGAIQLDENGSGPAFQRFGGASKLGSAWVVGSTPQHPEEVFRYDHRAFRRMTDSNPAFADIALGRQEIVRFTARDGIEIEGLLIHPTDADRGGRRPLVIVAHGGPEAHYSNGWLTGYAAWGQLLAGRGFYVWYPNYRASTGYGVAFAKLDHGDPMGAEFRDHLDAIAHFAEQGLIDTARVGIGGGSYGGYTAAWAATRHTEHFAAAVSFVPFVDIRTKWFTSDIPWEFYLVHYEEKWPHEQGPLLENRSPLTWAERCRTPLLLLGGTDDPRVHPAQPLSLYRAVKLTTRTPVRYVRYPGEGHGNRTNVYRYDFCVRTLQWFEHYLREGAKRDDAPPPFELDYSGWEGLGN